MEDVVEWYVGGAKLSEEAGLSVAELVDDVQVVVRGERGVYCVDFRGAWGEEPFSYPSSLEVFLEGLLCG